MVSKINFIVFFKKLFILIIIFSNSFINAQRGVRIGYIDMNIILNNITEYKKSTKILDDRIVQWKKEIELKKIQLSQFQNQLNTERVLLTSELIADREIEINDYANEIIALQEKRFGPNGDRIKQRKKLITPIQDQVLVIVQQIAKEKKYDFIFDRSSNIVMLYSAKNYDISDLVLKRIQIKEKIKARNQKLNALKNKN
ncbi:MAG: Skp family chaperone for outer membrane protein [Candidatus Marivariicella framensis]|jgi:Skp family chaperone for outer membrane proteins|tara:strand:- start:320 stop:916 length:597 start_codon:yes stop_codon:yes gene_type:complete